MKELSVKEQLRLVRIGIVGSIVAMIICLVATYFDMFGG